MTIHGIVKADEVASDLGYPPRYCPKSIDLQSRLLLEIFPSLPKSGRKRTAENQIPDGAEAWYVVPRWDKIAPTYADAVEKVFDLLSRAHGGKFVNFLDVYLSALYIQERPEKIAALKVIQKQNDGGLLQLVPAQFGLRHRGRSTKGTRQGMLPNEFGLGAFEAGIMLLTHPERLKGKDILFVNCPGDVYYSPYVQAADAQHDRTLVFHSAGKGHDGIAVSSYAFDGTSEYLGPTTFFVPEPSER